MSINWFKYSSPQTFFSSRGKAPRFGFGVLASSRAAWPVLGFFVAPTDAQQGEAYRIIFIHVPAAWMSMFLYVVMVFWAGLGLAFNTRLSGMMASAIAPTGALFTFIALWTGSFWGKPTWGTWWVLGRAAHFRADFSCSSTSASWRCKAAIDDPRRADKAGALLALVGVVNVPIIYFSVKWWNTLHQGASVSPNQGAEHGGDHARGHASS